MTEIIQTDEIVEKLQRIFSLDSVFKNILDEFYTIESNVTHKCFVDSEIIDLKRMGFEVKSVSYHSSRLYLVVGKN